MDSKVRNIINNAVKVGEELNAEKIEGISKLESRLDVCPNEWKQHTQRFIEVVKGNIVQRESFINKLKSMRDSDVVEVLVIITELEMLDKKDNTACDIYSAVMGEGIN